MLRVDGRHIWNPSNFGIVAMLLLAPDTRRRPERPVGQQPAADGGRLGVRRDHPADGRPPAHHATYVASFLVLRRRAQRWITGHPLLSEVAPITGPMYQLFIFFMITDPKTTVRPEVGAVRSSRSSSRRSRRSSG